MIDPNAIEQFFVNLLKDDLSPLPIDPFPSVVDVEDYKENINSAIGAVTIALRRISKSPSDETKGEFVFYPQFFIFHSSLQPKGGHVGVYSVIHTIVDKIDEKKFTIDGEIVNCYVNGADYVTQDDDLYCYALDVMIVPKFARFA